MSQKSYRRKTRGSPVSPRSRRASPGVRSPSQGRSWLFCLWAVTGPLFGFSDTWQLVINTGTTIVTFLMVFLIQNTQNRDTEAMQVKLDELIRTTKGAHTALLDLEELEDKELSRIRTTYTDLARKAREELRRGKKDTGIPEVK